MLNNPLANALSKIKNAENLGKSSCLVSPSSKTIKEVFKIMHENQFLGEFKEIETAKGGVIKVELIGKINNCGVIRPNYSAKQDNFEKFEKRYLPAKDFGILIVSTPKGIITQNQAKENKSGGVLLAYCY